VRAGDVGGEPAGAVDLQDALEITAAVAGELGSAAAQVVVRFFSAFPGRQ